MTFLTVGSAVACPVYIQPKLTDAREADAVIVGYVTKDSRNTSPGFKAWIGQWLSKDASRDDRREAQKEFNGAKLRVEIDHAISGEVPPTIEIHWLQMVNNGPPEHISGGYVFALRKLSSDASVDSVGTYAVLQGICSGALVYRRGSPEANTIREMFGLWPEPRERLAQDTGKVGSPSPALIVSGLLATAVALITAVAIWMRRRQ